MLQDIRLAQVDRIVVGGDVVPGPMPCETLKCLLELDTPVQFIYGNGELAMLAQMAARRNEGDRKTMNKIMKIIKLLRFRDPLIRFEALHSLGRILMPE